MHLTIVQNRDKISIHLKKGGAVVDEELLTISQEFDTLLIGAIDKLLERNRMDRLSLKSIEIQGKVELGAVSSMVLKTFKNAIEA